MANEKKQSQHVVPNSNGGWSVKKSNSTKSTATYKTQGEAIVRATEIAKNQKTELFVHRQDGTIRNRNSYGNDPNPPKDKRP